MEFRRGRRSFTLAEILVATSILVIMLMMLLSLVSQTSKIWQQANDQKTDREAARILLQMIGRDLENAAFPIIPTTTGLRFQLNPADASARYLNPHAAFWQAAMTGTRANNGDVADVGYFVSWVGDGAGVAHGTLNRMTIPPTNTESIFNDPTRSLASVIHDNAPGLSQTNGPTAYRGLIADNVLGLWITIVTRDATGTTNAVPAKTAYDSSTASPATRPAYADVSIVMVDPAVARRITTANLGLMVTNHYQAAAATNGPGFITALPAAIQAGARAFQARIQIQAGQ